MVCKWYIFWGLCVSWCSQVIAEDFHSMRRSPEQFLSRNERTIESHLEAILERLDSFEERLSEIGGQVAQLHGTSSPDRYKHVVEDLCGVCKELDGIASNGGDHESDTHPTSSPDETNGKDENTVSGANGPSTENQDPFWVRRVRKEVTGNRFLVTVEYEGSTKPEVFQRFTGFGEFSPVEHVQLGVLTSRGEIPQVEERPELHLQFKLPIYSVYVTVLLGESAENETTLPETHASLSSGNRVITTPGDEVEINFTVTVESENNRTSYVYFQNMFMVQSDTENNFVNVYFLHPETKSSLDELNIHYNQTLEKSGSSAAFVQIPPSFASGVVTFFMIVDLKCPHPCLVDAFFIHAAVKFYPQGHDGPFPPNFVGFTRKWNGPLRLENENEVRCDTSGYRQCFVDCSVLGDNPSADITQIRTRRPQNYYNVQHVSKDDHASAHIDLTNVTVDDAGEYVCSARSGEGPAITRTFTLKVRESAKIVKEHSRVWKFSNGSLAALCMARGTPIPRVSFTEPGRQSPLDDLNDWDYYISTREMDETTSAVYLIVPDPEIAEPLYTVECFASNAPEGEPWDKDFMHLYVDED